MTDVHSIIREQGGAVFAALDALAPADADADARVTQAMRQLVTVRDLLLVARRQEIDCADELARVNAIVSFLFGVESPSDGVQWKRVCEARDALRVLVRDLG